jgi:hypothetical protein
MTNAESISKPNDKLGVDVIGQDSALGNSFDIRHSSFDIRAGQSENHPEGALD